MTVSDDLLVEELLPLIIESRRVVFISDYLSVLLGRDEYVPRFSFSAFSLRGHNRCVCYSQWS